MIENISKETLLEHLLKLDVDSRRMRFGHAASDTAIESYVNGIHDHDIIIGIRESIYVDSIVAAIHLAVDEDDRTAELGISTLPQFRRKGYAERLLRFGIDILRNRNIRQLYTMCLPENQPLMTLLRKLNITVITSSEGEKEARVSIPMAGIDSVYHEMYNTRLVVIDKAMKPWAKLWVAMMHKD